MKEPEWSQDFPQYNPLGMEGYRAHNSNTHYALCLIPLTGYGCVLCFITKCLSVVCILRSTK